MFEPQPIGPRPGPAARRPTYVRAAQAERQHDLTLAEGNFRVVLTKKRQVVAHVTAKTVIGPVNLSLRVDHGISKQRIAHLRDQFRRHAHVVGYDPANGMPIHLLGYDASGQPIHSTGFFKNIGRWVSRAAESTFNKVSKAVTSVARPVLSAVRDAASHGMRTIARTVTELPQTARKALESASRIVLRARLGDLKAKGFIRGIINAAKRGVASARKVGDALLSGARVVARAVDLPVHLLKDVPGLGKVVQTVSPFQRLDRVLGAVQRGDVKALKDIVKDDLSLAQGVISLIPGIGTGISSAISAGLAVLEGGGALEVALKAAYGAIPIPPGLRQITDAVVNGVLALAQKGADLTDAALAAARDRLPGGLPRQVFDTLVNIVVKRVPVRKAASDLANHYVRQYGGPAAQAVTNAQRAVQSVAPRVPPVVMQPLFAMAQ